MKRTLVYLFIFGAAALPSNADEVITVTPEMLKPFRAGEDFPLMRDGPYADEVTIVTPWKTYTDVRIVNVTPTFVEIRAPHAFIPFRHLSPENQARFRQDPAEIAKIKAAGIDGVYREKEGVIAFAGENIVLKNGRFTYSTSSDTVRGSGPFEGTYTLEGNWITLHHKKIQRQYRTRILVEYEGRIVMMRTYDYAIWKSPNVGRAIDPLYKRKPE
ncbi:hypothetical protein ACXR0O_04925 [Verrucomicrobiota bacterium sgz303538]